MTKQTTKPLFDWLPLATALSDYMMVVSGRQPTLDEMWDIYWSAVDAIERVAKDGVKKAESDGP